MPPRKRKATALFECDCEDEDHDDQKECNEATRRETSKSITAKIVPFSKMATVLVGPEKQPFSVPQDLLTLHSTFFRRHFGRADQNIVLPTVDSVLFANFVAWLYLLELPWEPDDGIYVDDGDAANTVLDRAWALGSFLGAPSYQNTQMKDYQEHCRGSSCDWPDILSITAIYKVTSAGSKLRNFAADSMASQSPFKRHASESPEFTERNNLLLQCSELSLDVIHAGAKEWGGAFPWDDDNLDAYMKDETLLDQAWEEQILEKRGIEEIRKEAKKKCFRSMFELAHLERNKSKD
ncbi:hypothetical protein IFR04_007742 [Cadophora malorum]|uniref:BTB domain-containing protein n=1 Tax=Cadophora malorum TaxID=108018 RepID=A0A8H7TGR5_9HELO|nr:hypothetical protein IFR04_007742 [Cadophora malorum]